ncbi:biopolymer transporter ExbD [Longimicrobium sp.]|uniref:ExbD/TolR family protein n=1 Tax=Longimicrobium sp. TaxID=2029185 RepID=UPI002B55312E|nr:biopolymer transporter ExbD [Longimicrobium sp.]HSU16896.1 biopolymer transporter ExbD [Longimicrobium sp.]
MGMAAAKRGGAVAEINVTPMIDVLLVLLIIFMVVQQGLRRGMAVQVPPPKTDPAAPSRPDGQIVLEVLPGGRYAINTQPVGAEGLQSAVERTFAGRPRKVLFVKGGENLTYGDVVTAVDATRAAGVEVIGLVPRAGS